MIDGEWMQVVSLGRGCQPAHQIRRICGATTAHIFDWIVTTDRGLVELISSDLEGFFAREHLGRGVHNCVIDVRNDTQFLHEFPAASDFDAQYQLNASKFQMLAARWRELLSARDPVLFVRQHGWDIDVGAAAARLREAIVQRAPHLNFVLLYLVGQADDNAWSVPGVINRRLRQPEPYDWRGDDAAWESLLNEARSLVG